MSSTSWQKLGLVGLGTALLWLGSCDPADPSKPDDRSQGNVRFGSCSSSSCGSDPSGVWRFTSGCMTEPPGGFTCADGVKTASGQGSGTIVIDDGSFNLSVKVDVRQCGADDDGSDAEGGLYTITGTTLDLGNSHAVAFCVAGDSLTLIDPNAVYPNLSLLAFDRVK